MRKLLLISIPITLVIVVAILFVSLQGVDIGEPGADDGSCGSTQLGIVCTKYLPPPNITWPDLLIRFCLYSIALYPAVVLFVGVAKWRIENPILADKKIIQPSKKLKKPIKRKTK